MSPEDTCKQALAGRFPFLAESISIRRKGRLFVQCPQEKLSEVFDFSVRDLGFDSLSAISGMDEVRDFCVIYHLNRDGQVLLNLETRLPKDRPSIPSVTRYFPGADIYEREMADLLGIAVEGLSPGHRYPLPDSWPKGDHPLRKDWKPKTSNKGTSHA